MAENVYGVALMVLTELDTDGMPKADGQVIYIDSPQQVSYAPNVTEGQRTELRGGDRLLAVVKEDDVLESITATFQDAKLNGEAMAMIGGGTWTPGGEYEAPKLSDTSRTPFMAEIYSATYGDGSKAAGDIEGYVKVTLWYCKGRIPSFAQQDRAFLVPSYTITSTENAGQDKGPFSITTIDVGELPTVP